MNPQKYQFLQALQLPIDLSDEECTQSVSKLISLAAREPSPAVSLKEIHEAVARYDCSEYLEPLEVLPTLLPSRRDGAMDLIRICGLHNSPKEVMIVIQEAIEYLQTHLDQETDEEEEEELDLVQRAIGIVLLCSPAISRSRLEKISALELCSPVLEHITSLMLSISPYATKVEGRVLITEVAHLAKSLAVWASVVTNSEGIKRLLRKLLDTTVVNCALSIDTSLAIRTAQSYFPRLFVKLSAKEGWQDGEGAMIEVQRALEHLGNSPQTMNWKPRSLSDLIYLAHSTPTVVLSPSTATDLYLLLINALQMNVIIDESLFLLLRALSQQNMSISPDIAALLCTVLTALASTHMNPAIRQLNLRLLSLTLSKLPPQPRLEMLFKLSKDEDFPQIRGPALGLLKEAVLEALALPPDHTPRNPFASQELLRVFGEVLFRPNPPDFLSTRKTRKELAQSLELLRIADCLSFYYVLLQRDLENKTGVRSKDNVTSVQSSILRPLQQFLDAHSGEEPTLMVMLPLQDGLDRINGALRKLELETVCAA